MKPRTFCTVFVVVMLLPAAAYAQTPDGITITPSYVITSLLGVLIGYLATAYNTGKVLGQITVPKPWLPWVGIVLTFTQAFAVALGKTPTASTAFLGLIAGLLAIAGNAGGSALHSMTTAHLSSRGVAASNGGPSSGSKPAVVGAVGSSVSTKTPNNSQRQRLFERPAHGRLSMVWTLAVGVLLGVLVSAAPSGAPSAATRTATVGCKSPQQAITGVFTVEQLVCMVDAMVSGQLTGTPQVIAADVQAACQVAPALTTDIITFVQDFQNLTPAQQQHWASWSKAHKAAAPAASVTPASAAAPAASH